ncbi:hypothetical protein JXO59_06300 [candidate division KSB1 bacterium]|nr:hypothetical protein [candidate division KSB1 bacterium]
MPAMVIDRASDVHAQLLPCLTTLKHRGAFFINDPDRMAWCRDKATMHLELVSEGVMVPYGIIISRFDLPEQVFPFAAEKLGVPFVIKPSEGGGGEGVVLNASEVQDIRRALETSRTGKVVLQKKITPQMINHRRAWFRVFYLLGRIIPCWWDDLTHLYQPLIADDLDSDLIETVERVMKDIAKTCQLAFFSSEFALDQSNQLQVIDFVNEMCDMRMRSRHMDGVPDDIVFKIIRDISAFCKGLIHAKTTRAGT